MAVCIDGTCMSTNAWVSFINECADLLDLAYASRSGEIWLYDNDLKALDNDILFNKLYLDRIDGSLARHVKCVKIVAKEGRLFNQLFDKNSNVFKNLCKLRPGRLKTFYIGRLETLEETDEQPSIDDLPQLIPLPKEKGSARDHPWIFYLGDRVLSENGITILRPQTDPFDQSGADTLGSFAIAWGTRDDRSKVLSERLLQTELKQLFVDKLSTHFRSLEPEFAVGTQTVIGYHLTAPRTDDDVRQIVDDLDTRGRLPSIIPPVDVGIVTALDEEFHAVITAFGLTSGENHDGYEFGWIGDGEDRLSIVAVQTADTGSVEAALTTERLLNDWRPKCILLLGRCGADGDDLQEGDVIVATSIKTYEYQSISDSKGSANGWTSRIRRWLSPTSRQVGGNGDDPKYEVKYEVRDVPVNGMMQFARKLVRESWAFPRTHNKNSRHPSARFGKYVCGCKLVRAGRKWFEETRRNVGDRKVMATEMEAEGAGKAIERAALHHHLHPHFMMIKSISDFANMGKSDERAEFASETAAGFALDMLKLPGVKGILK